MSARLARVVAAAVVAAGTSPFAGWTTPASSAVCADAGGVSVVVDFRELGGGVQATCDGSGGGETAAALFTGNGFPLTYVQRQPGFVCRVSGVPADDPCVNTPPANAYWGLYWSDGTSGSWSYSSLGVGSLTIPAGGSVALAWQGQSQGPPGVAAPSHGGTSSPSPTPSPTKTPTKGSTESPTKSPSPTGTRTPTSGASATGSSNAPGAPSSSAAPSPTPGKASESSRSPSPPASEEESPTPQTDTGTTTTAAPTTPPSEATDPASSGAAGSAVPLPVVIAVLAALAGLLAGTVVLRRARSTGDR